MSYLKKVSLGSLALLLLPSFAFAKDITDLKDLISYVMEILNSLIPLLFAIAFIAFVWGIIKYLYAAGPQKLAEARNYIIFGILAMAVMLSVFGLATLVKNSFFPSSPTPIDVNDGSNNLIQYKNTAPGNTTSPDCQADPSACE